MSEKEIIDILVTNFRERLETAEIGLIYSIYGEYLKQQAELLEGKKENEV